MDSMIFILSLHRNRFIDYTQFLEIHILSIHITVSYILRIKLKEYDSLKSLDFKSRINICEQITFEYAYS